MRTSIAILLLLLAASAAGAVPPSNLLANGDFSSVGHGGVPDSWTPLSRTGTFASGSDDSGRFLTIGNTDSTATVGISQTVPLNPEWAKVLVRGYVRVDSLTPAANGSVTVALAWRMKGSAQAPPINAYTWSTVTPPTTVQGYIDKGWCELNNLLTVPEGATGLIVSPQIANATGTADFRDLSMIGWVQTFDDEFDGSSVDTSRWSVSEGLHNTSADEQEWFSADHVTVHDGYVQIHADQVAKNGQPYQSGDIMTKGKFQQLYGLFELRLKLPETIGGWPAAYLLKWDDGWPPEIDVCELSGNDMRGVLETNHFADDYGRHSQSQVNWDGSGIDRTQWHTYAVVWEPGQVAWYFDGEYKGTTHVQLTSDVPMYVRINLAVGSYGGDPTRGTWPQDFECDWAHVYQRHDYPLPVYPASSEEVTLPQSSAPLTAISCAPMTGAQAQWTLIDGPKGCRIDDPHALDTRATFFAPGMYRFHLQVTKGESTGGQDFLVFVNPAPGRQGS